MTVRLPAVLRHPAYRLLVGGQVASNVGDAFYAVALPWYVLGHHGGAVLLGLVLAAYGIPRIVLVAVGGQAADRWSPWTVMMGADLTRAATVTGLGVAALAGPPRAAVLIPIAAVIGAGEGLFLPGSMSIIPALLPDSELQSGNALSSAGTQLATLVGPAVGGGLVALAGAAPAFFLDAGSFLVSAATLAGIRARARRAAPAPADGGAEPDGRPLLGLLRTEPVLIVILLVILAANLGGGGMGDVALPALARGPWHAGAGGYGALVAALAAGGLVGALVASRSSGLRRPALVGSVLLLAAAAIVAVAPYLGGALPAGFAVAAFGGLVGFSNVVFITAFQRWAPAAVLGRLMALVLMCSFGAFPVSVALAGVVTRTLGAAAFFPLTGAVLALAVSGGLTQRSWRRFGEQRRAVPVTASSLE